jgi:uncharacterized protein
MEARINIITLGVTDLNRSEEFYCKGLGWKKSSASQESIIFLQLGGLVLALYPCNLLAEDATISLGTSLHPPVSMGYNTKNEEEVDKTMALALKSGAMLIKPAQKVFWGGYSGYFADPDGFLWEVAYNPFIAFDDHNNLLLP